MNFGFFESLTRADAEAFLERFLDVESSVAPMFLASLSRELSVQEYSIDSVAPALRFISSQISTFKKNPDDHLPDWITTSPSYARGLFEFDDASKVLILRGAHYLGESFVRTIPHLKWSTGHPDTAEQNMPVVTGFQSSLEMAPMLIVENLFRRMIADNAEPAVIDVAVDFWKSKSLNPPPPGD